MPKVDRLTLTGLREQCGLTQTQLAKVMGTTQSGVSRIERQDDVRLSTLRAYVEGVGARLCVVADLGVISVEVDIAALRSD